MIDSALWLAEHGYNIIPVNGKTKKPYIPWIKYQTERASVQQVDEWWNWRKDAAIGIICGKISNVMVVDIDNDEAMKILEEYLPDNIITPIESTPRGGRHFYFKYQPGLSSKSYFLPHGFDVKTDGGYVICAPSTNGNGKNYEWLKGLKIEKTPLASMPEFLFDVLTGLDQQVNAYPSAFSLEKACISSLDNTNNNTIYNISETPSVTSPQQDRNKPTVSATNVTGHTVTFDEGGRDNTIFHIANSLYKGGMQEENIRKVLSFIAKNCSPPFPESELAPKIVSATQRATRRTTNLTQSIREYVMEAWGLITVNDVLKSVCQTDIPEERAKVRTILTRLVSEKIIEPTGGKNGVYRRVENEVEELDWKNADMNYLDFYIPLGISEMAGVLPGNVIIIAGAKDSGKTSFLMNIAKENRHKYKVHYFNSEMGPGEFKLRASNFEDISIDQWHNVRVLARADNFDDVVIPGEGNLNIIDFIEIHDSFYKIAEQIKKIHDKLKGALAVIALQKNKGVELGRGGSFSLEKARLYLSLDRGVAKIISAKNFKPESPIGNPAGYKCNYKLVGGAKIIKDHNRGWHREDD